MVYRQSNPALNPKYFQPGMGSKRMSLEGTISKTLTLLSFVGITALIAYSPLSTKPSIYWNLHNWRRYWRLYFGISHILHQTSTATGFDWHVCDIRRLICWRILIHGRILLPWRQ